MRSLIVGLGRSGAGLPVLRRPRAAHPGGRPFARADSSPNWRQYE